MTIFQQPVSLDGFTRHIRAAFVLTRYVSLRCVTAHQSALPKFAYPGLLNLAAPALGAWRQNLAAHGVG
jgi:hypothetical protein